MAVLSEEQTMLRDAAKGWADVRSPIAAFRKVRDAAEPLRFDPASWREQGGLGWAGVIIPEEFGGAGFGYLSMGLVLEELGRSLVASPLLASGIVAASAIMLGGSKDQKREWLPALAEGRSVATLACDEGKAHAPDRVSTKALRNGPGWTLSGQKTFVMEGPAADLFVVSARMEGDGGDEIELFLVRGDAAGVDRQVLRTMDSRGYANIQLRQVEGELLGAPGSGRAVLEVALDRARAGLAAEMLGSAGKAFEITLDYLKTRSQFGHLIGSFQALQHRAARMFMELELARSTVEAALQAIDDHVAEVPELVSLAKATVGETFHLVSNETVQMHGGIGMTDEHDAGLFLKRARVSDALFGNQAYHRNRYARLLGY